MFTVCFTNRSVKLANMAAESIKLSDMPSYFIAFVAKTCLREKNKGHSCFSENGMKWQLYTMCMDSNEFVFVNSG